MKPKHSFFSVNFVKLSGKLFCWTHLSNHLWHHVVFHWGLQTKINLFGGAIRNSQPHPILCSYGNQAEKSLSSCGHTCTDLDIPIAGKVEEKEELKSLLKWGKFSFYVMVDCKIVTYLKNKKQLILIVNKKFKIFDF